MTPQAESLNKLSKHAFGSLLQARGRVDVLGSIQRFMSLSSHLTEVVWLNIQACQLWQRGACMSRCVLNCGRGAGQHAEHNQKNHTCNFSLHVHQHVCDEAQTCSTSSAVKACRQS